ncbi:MAG: S-adenosylmethionine:tRNA ribosyltransferase-isomerase [Paludibacter sp.]|nr:S-adenosylmethionine:tRNA ribosyltransferase-isomerase [Paludibacter sp.]
MPNKPIYIADYDYALPEERIAKFPLVKRDDSKLLIYRDGQITEDRFYNVKDFLPADALLVCNNTRVIQARLHFEKQTGAKIEIFCLEPHNPADYALSLGATGVCEWKCIIGNLKKWKDGVLHKTIVINEITLDFTAERKETDGNTHTVSFRWDCADVTFAEILECAGELPIPPYLKRKTEESDKTAYQTVYAKTNGSVAAPTAGLHFTPETLASLEHKNIEIEELTLHVGAGTFLPVKTADANAHTMHTEIIEVRKSAIERILANLGNIVAVGTTSVRTLESLYFIGAKLTSLRATTSNPLLTGDSRLRGNDRFFDSSLCVEQFEPYEKRFTISAKEALQNILNYLRTNNLNTLHAETQIMIRAGYSFKIVDAMLTNFHQPRSTLLLLVSAFAGGDWRTIYDYALAHDFRFLSYGDSSLLFKHTD